MPEADPSPSETSPFVPRSGTAVMGPPLPPQLFGSSLERIHAPTRPADPPSPVDLIAETAQDPDAEMVGLLCRRLRQLVLVFLAAYAAFLFRDLLSPDRDGLWFQQAVFLAVTPVQLLLVAVTWSRWANSLVRLRALEWAVLIICWSTLGYLQFEWLSDWEDIGFYIQGVRHTDGQILIANTWVVPWFALIAGYPVIIPNPGRRALLLAGLMAMIPFLVTGLAMCRNPMLTPERVDLMLVQYGIWFSLGIGVAAYGAHQSSLLRRQAQEARRFGQYRLTRRIGVGGMGAVYLAEHLLLKRPSVIKTIHPARARDPAALKRFEREVQILATLTHPNTVAVFDYGYTVAGTFYYVMEYLPGMDLDRLVRKFGPLPAGRTVHLLRQVCAALREAHAVGLTHRDVKPGNVMVCRRGGVCDVAKLLDFGLVQEIDSPLQPGPVTSDRITQEGTVLGTPAFMSPEQAAGHPLDGRSDIYSLGATAYFLLTGRLMFQKETPMEVITAHLQEHPRPPRAVNPAIPEDLETVVLRCLVKSPADRLATVAALDVALRRCGCAGDWDEEQAAGWWAEAEKYDTGSVS